MTSRSEAPSDKPQASPGSNPEPAGMLHERFSRRLVLLVVISIALAWSLLGFDLWRMHERRVANARDHAANLALAVEQRVVRTLRVTDQTLKVLREEITHKHAWSDPGLLAQTLGRLTPHLDEILTIAFIANDGFSVAHSNPDIASGQNYATRDFFRFHSGHQGDTLFVEKPIVGQASGQRIFTLSRPVFDQQGIRLGILNASVRSDSLSGEFESLRVGNSDSVGFHHLPSYRIIVRQPDYEKLFGQETWFSDLQEAIKKAPHGIFEGQIPDEGVQRYFAYRTIEDLPLVVSAGVSKPAIMAELLADLAGYLAMLVFLSLVIVSCAAVVLRAYRQETALKDALAAKDALFKIFFDAVPVGMGMIDQEMRYRLVNPAFARINAGQIDDFLDKTVDAVQPALRKKFLPIHQAIFSSGRHFQDVEIHGEVPGNPGVSGCWEASFFPIRNAQDQIEGMGYIVVDVTERNAAENALRRWQQIFEHADWGIVVGSADARTLELMNPAFARMHGYTEDELVGQSVDSVFAPEVRDQLPTYIARSHELGHYRFESLHQHRDGRIFPVLIDTTTVRGEDGSVLYRVVNVQDMSEQKRAEQALRRSEKLLSTVLDTLPVGVWIADPQGQIIRSNPVAERIWQGRRMVGPEGYGEYKAWRVDDGAPIAAEESALARAFANGETTIGEMIEIACFDGTHKTILNSAVPLHDPESGFLGVILVNENITEFRRAQDEIRIARDFFEHTFNAAPVGMAIADLSGRYTRVNRAMAEFVGYSQEELLSMSYMDITHPDDLEANNIRRHELLTSDADSFLMEKRYIRKDGLEVWAVMVVTAVRDNKGEVLYTIGQMLDIDRQKKAEQTLKISEMRFRAIFENASTGIAAIDMQGTLVYFNQAFIAMLGYEAEALRQMNLADLTHPEDLLREKALIAQLCANEIERFRMEKRCFTSSGDLLWIDIAVSSIRDANDQIVNLVAVVYDITERKHGELALTISRQKLRALSAYQARILEEDRKHVAREIHDELGQLLTALKMDISLVRIGFGENPKLLEKIEQMRVLVDQTIDVVRHVATNLRPSALDLGLLPAIEWLADDFAARWEIPCKVVTDGEKFAFNDQVSTAVFRVVQESLTNIARHADASRVTITLIRDHDKLQISVRDDGRGFNPSSLGKEKRFGLFGMRERVLSLGGKLNIVSTPGEGTTIAITLPIQSSTSS